MKTPLKNGGKRLPIVIPSILIYSLMITLTGCKSEVVSHDEQVQLNTSPAEEASIRSDSSGRHVSETPTNKTVVAIVNDYPIQQADVDQKIRLQLHDLEWQKYQLRRQALSALITETIDETHSTPTTTDEQADVSILLKPPIPPKITLPDNKLPPQDEGATPLTVSVFCSFQSPHCARMQPVFRALVNAYPHQISLQHYDYPLSFHRNARPAANAARCANEQGKFWSFSSALYAHQNDLNNARYLLIADQLGINHQDFRQCIEGLKYRHDIEQDVATGEALGLSNAPVTFINGLYIKGPADLNTLRFYADHALQTLPADTARHHSSLIKHSSPIKSQLPLRLLAISVSNKNGQSSVVMEHVKHQESRRFYQNDTIDLVTNTEIQLVAIESKRIIINHQGRLEFLMLSGESDLSTMPSHVEGDNAVKSSPDHDSVRTNSSNQTASQTGGPTFNEGHRELPRTAITPLSRDWLDQQLVNQSQLEQHFQPAEHQVEGQHLLKLEQVAQQAFYQTLGLQDGDVVLRVNDKWLHDSQNTLWDTLSQQNKITVQLMRQGLPVRLDYAVE